MARRPGVALVTLLLALAACTASPDPSPEPDDCAGDLPPRTSPIDYPVAVLHVGGDDLAPVVGDIEWLGGDEAVETTAPLAVHLERFIVTQTRARSHASLRMTDGVAIAAWTVDAMPLSTFRSGDLEADRVRWSEGSERTEVVCVPLSDGEWAVAADITFADDAGSATFYWRLNVVEAPAAT